MLLLLALAVLLQAAVPAEAVGGYLRWTYNESNAYYPFDTRFPPAIVRGEFPGEERVVTLHTRNNQWQVSALDIITGASVWEALFPGDATTIVPLGVTTGAQGQQMGNSLNLAFLQIGATLTAMDGVTGAVAWQWEVPTNFTLTTLTGWGDTVGILIESGPIFIPTSAAPITYSQILSVDVATGALRFQINASDAAAAMPTNPAAVDCLVVGEESLLYSKGSKMAAIDKATGAVVWSQQIPLEGSVGTGQGANITHINYIPRGSDDELPTPPRLLLNANNWSFQRFLLYQLNDTNTSIPASVLWRSKQPETAINDPKFANPVVDFSPGSESYYYWSNRTNWNTGPTPTWEVYMVGRDLRTGNERWAQKMDPVGVPTVWEGRVVVVNSRGLVALQGASGQAVWEVDQPPTIATYSYNVAPTFGNETGMLVASRCLGPTAPALCMYSAFAPASGAMRRSLGGSGLAAVLVVTVMTVLTGGWL